MLGILMHFLKVWIKKPISLICLGVMLVLFIPAFQSVDLDPLLSVILLIVVIVLAIAASFAVLGLRSAMVVLTSGARVKELAKRYPELAEMERKRSSLVGIKLIFFAACAVVFVLSVMVLGVVGVGSVTIAAPIVYLLLIRKKEVELRDSFKQVVVLDELTRVFTDVRFDPLGCFSSEEMNGLQLFRGLDRMSGNDLIEASRGNIRFCRCDMHLESVHVYEDADEGEKVAFSTIFKGSAFRFELSEPVPVRLLAATESFPNLREADGLLKKLLGRAGENSVETEMDEFNRRFDVYCSDQIAARILLTPQMIESINRVGRLTGYELAMLFEGSSLYLFLSTPNVDSFEVTISGHQSLKKQHEIVAAQVALIAALVDSMYFKGTATGVDIADQQLTSAQAKIAAGKRQPAVIAKLPAFKSLVFSSLPLIMFLVFFISSIYALFACPYGIALGISIYDGVVTAKNFVPVFPYMLMIGIFMGVFCVSARRNPTGFVAAVILLLIHFLLLWGSLTA